MARFTVYLPDELYQRARDELPDTVSLSRILADGVTTALDCPHRTVVCQACHVELPGADYQGAHLSDYQGVRADEEGVQASDDAEGV